MRILVTGGTGYIGSHTVVALLAAGQDVVILDDFSNSDVSVLDRIAQIAGRAPSFAQGDVKDSELVERLLKQHSIDAVIHFAAFKAVGESVAEPLKYYENNVAGTLSLCQAMQRVGVHTIVFSSSATVYGTPSELPLKETSSVGQGLTNPYGRSKYMVEQILQDLGHAQPDWHITILRYFNPIGAHESGLIGENPHGVPNNLLPYICRVATGSLDKLHVYGDDYDTPDGTGVRDYIHVVDLADGHVAALSRNDPGVEVYNLGTGSGTSVLELLHAFEKASGKTIPYDVVPRRPGDVASCYADASKAAHDLSWHAQRSIEQACADAWRWQQNLAKTASTSSKSL